MQPQAMGTVMPTQHMASDKDWIVTLVLSILVGTLGIDRFYTGNIVLGFKTHHVWGLGCGGSSISSCSSPETTETVTDCPS